MTDRTEILHVLDRATTILASRLSEYRETVKQLEMSTSYVNKAHSLIEELKREIGDSAQERFRAAAYGFEREQGNEFIDKRCYERIEGICNRLKGRCVLPNDLTIFKADIQKWIGFMTFIKASAPETDQVMTLLNTTADNMLSTPMPPKPPYSCVIC